MSIQQFIRDSQPQYVQASIRPWLIHQKYAIATHSRFSALVTYALTTILANRLAAV
jgi:hypothetical protein